MVINFIVISLIVIAILLPTRHNTNITCDMIGEPHQWVERGEEDNKYMVCERCRVLPCGFREEG